jgi:simple sugar transport system permease protein
MSTTVSQASAPSAPQPAPAAGGRQRSVVSRLLARPEVGALAAAIAIFVFFSIIAEPFLRPASLSTILYASSTIGIMAVGVALLMIGGEFDLSAGVAVVTAALCASMVSYQLNLNLWVGSLVSLLLALTIGFLNGYLVVKTGIPSFLVTLGTFFMLQGVNLGITKIITGTVSTQSISAMDGYSSLEAIFNSRFDIAGVSVRITVVWWLLFVAIATWVLLRTRIGNWIFAVGGNADSARAVGVPVTRVKIGLFMTVGFLAWFFGMHRLYAFSTVQSGEGVGNEFLYIIAAVVGGCLLTGGYGSAIGAAVGAAIFGMTTQGIVFAGWDANWFRFFLGAMLLLATLLNLYVKRLSTRR